MIERREFLGYSLAAVSAGSSVSADAAARFDHAVILGRRILGEGHLPADIAALRVDLAAGDEKIEQLFGRDWSAKITEDFAAQRVVPADGWSLSHTEAALCALAALELGTMG